MKSKTIKHLEFHKHYAVVCWEMMVDRKRQYCFCRDKKLCSDNIDGCKEICDKRKRCDNCFKKSVVTIIYVG